MHYGIFTYGSRGDVQPFIALALGLKERGHRVTLGAPENFQSTIESYKVAYHKIDGDLEKMLYEPEIQSLLESGNVFALLRGLQKSADKNHELLLPQCKLAIFHGGAGTLSSVLKAQIPLIIVSIFGDQPIWGKLIEKRKLGKHISAHKLTFDNFTKALKIAQTEEMKNNVYSIGKAIKSENGVDKAIGEIEPYFERFSGDKQALFAQK